MRPAILLEATPDSAVSKVDEAVIESVLAKHRSEPNECRSRVLAGLRRYAQSLDQSLPEEERKALAVAATNDVRLAKVAAETLDLIQRMERRAWNMIDTTGPGVIVIERSYANSDTPV